MPQQMETMLEQEMRVFCSDFEFLTYENPINSVWCGNT